MSTPVPTEGRTVAISGFNHFHEVIVISPPSDAHDLVPDIKGRYEFIHLEKNRPIDRNSDAHYSLKFVGIGDRFGFSRIWKKHQHGNQRAARYGDKSFHESQPFQFLMLFVIR
jgi:hypothetical protein